MESQILKHAGRGALTSRHDVDMLHGNIFTHMFAYALPVMLSGILQLLFNTADVIVVGRYASDSKKALAAVGSTGSLTSLIISLFIGLSVGACVVLSHKLGNGDAKGASDTVHTSVFISLVFGVVLSTVGIALAPVFLRWMDTQESVIDWSTLYMRIYFIGMPMTMLYNFGSAILRAKGGTKYPMLVLTCAGVANVVLNVILVTVFHLDVAGVAIATVMSQTVSALMVLFHISRLDDCCRFSFRRMKPDMKILAEIAQVGIPAGIQSMFFSISNVMLQAGVNQLGDTAMAGNTTGSNIDGYLYISCNALYHATLAFTGQNYGAHQYRRIKKIAVSAILIVTIIGLTLGSLVLILEDPLLELYSPGIEKAAIRENAALRLQVTALTYFICGLMEVACGLLRGIGNSTVPMIISLIGSCVFRIVWIKTLFAHVPQLHNLGGLFISYPISWIITSIAEFAAFMIVFRHRVPKGTPDAEDEPLPEAKADGEAKAKEFLTASAD